MMAELMNRQERRRLLLLVLSACGLNCVTVIGTIIAISKIAELHGQTGI